MRWGTGDYEDPPEIAEDREIPTYYVELSVTTDPNDFRNGGGSFDTLKDAVDYLESVPYIAPSLRWR